MHLISVGKPYPGLQPPLPPGAFFNWTEGGLELLLSFDRPSPAEVEDVRVGECAFALAVVPEAPAAVFLLWRFGKALPWSDAPYTPHLLPPDRQPVLTVLATPESRLAPQVVLVDSRSAAVRVVRLVTFSPEFSRALAAAVEVSARSRWAGRQEYDWRLALAYGRYPTTDALLKRATHRTTGGA